jgi:hypothetical protein
MKTPNHTQKLVSIPAICQVLVEFIEDTEEGAQNVYRQQLKMHAKGLIKASDSFLNAVYGYSKQLGHDKIMADEQNNMALAIKDLIAQCVEIEE